MLGSNYVQARIVDQKGGISPRQADVWLGAANQIDENGVKFVTLEIQPAYGAVAQIRLSISELRMVSELILERVGDSGGPGVPVQVNVPKGALIEITYESTSGFAVGA